MPYIRRFLTRRRSKTPLSNPFERELSLLNLNRSMLDLHGELGEFVDTNKKLSIPQITKTLLPEPPRSNNSPRSASFSGVQETSKQPRLRRGSMQVPSLAMARRRSSVCGSLIHAPGVLKRDLSDPVLKNLKSEKQPSVAPRARSGSVFARRLELPVIGLFRGRRRSGFLSAKEIKIFQVSQSHSFSSRCMIV